jgi:CRP-like cAMP-binding protein
MSRLPWPPNSLLGRVSRPAREELLGLGVRREVGADEVLIRQGEFGSHMVLLVVALVKITTTLVNGRQALLAIRESGDLVGEMSALDGTRRAVSVTTCRPSIVSVIHRTDFRAFLRRHPETAVAIAGITDDRLCRANQRLADFTAFPVRVRLARALAEIALSHGRAVPSGVQLGLRLTNDELATLCGAAEVTLQRALRELREAGVIDTGYRQILVRDLSALRRAGYWPLAT